MALCAAFAGLAACSQSSATKEAAGTIVQTKRTLTDELPVSPASAADAAASDAAAEAAKGGAGGDAAGAANAAKAVGAKGNGK